MSPRGWVVGFHSLHRLERNPLKTMPRNRSWQACINAYALCISGTALIASTSLPSAFLSRAPLLRTRVASRANCIVRSVYHFRADLRLRSVSSIEEQPRAGGRKNVLKGKKKEKRKRKGGYNPAGRKQRGRRRRRRRRSVGRVAWWGGRQMFGPWHEGSSPPWGAVP